MYTKKAITMVQKTLRAMAGAVIACAVLSGSASAQVYTISPTPFQTVLDNSGNIQVGACVWTYAAGTTTPIATYSSNAGAVNANPIRADFAGRFTAYLLAGTTYKFVYESSCTPPAHGTVYRTADNIAGVPSSASNVDITGTAGETIGAGQCAYLSDGSGGKTAGSWFKCDSGNTYSATTPEIGIAPSAITSGSPGTIRIIGYVTGLSSLSVGAEYFVGAAGAVTSTAPANTRHVGHADTATTLVLTGDPSTPPVLDNGTNGFRVGASTTACTPSADVTAATSVFLTPCNGNRIVLYSSTGAPTTYTSAEISIAVPATTSQMYDIFVFANSGVPALELLAWTNDTTRATGIARTTTGVYCKSGDLTRRYVGSFRTTTVSGQTEDSVTKRYVWNYYNRAHRIVTRYETTASWNYTTATVRQANAAAANQIDVVVGVQEVELDLTLNLSVSGTTTVSAGIGEDSTTTYVVGQPVFVNSSGSAISVRLSKQPAVGRHFYSWNEWSTAVGTTTWNGAVAAVGSTITSGLVGYIEG